MNTFQFHILVIKDGFEYVKKIDHNLLAAARKVLNTKPNECNDLGGASKCLDDKKKKKLLIFDLEETLVHCFTPPDAKPSDAIITINTPNGRSLKVIITTSPYQNLHSISISLE